jgi:hypothetical protein
MNIVIFSVYFNQLKFPITYDTATMMKIILFLSLIWSIIN